MSLINQCCWDFALNINRGFCGAMVYNKCAPARQQGDHGTCSVFAMTALAEMFRPSGKSADDSEAYLNAAQDAGKCYDELRRHLRVPLDLRRALRHAWGLARA
jgi:hypothetical protein